ncbi:MAG: ATP-dependent zinc protease [Candidatus Methylacidiphilales bacterium]
MEQRDGVQKLPFQLIGRREYVYFPDWDVGPIRAKIDTGARSPAIDVASIELLPSKKVRFGVIADNKKRETVRHLECRISRRSTVRSSNGKSEERFFVKTRMRLGGHIRMVEIGLVCRKNMLCRALIGRTCLEGVFWVDVSGKYLLGKE